MKWRVVITAFLLACSSVSSNEVTEPSADVEHVTRKSLPFEASILGPVDVARALQELVKQVAYKAGLNITLPTLQICRIPDDEYCRQMAGKMLIGEIPGGPIPIVLLSAPGHRKFQSLTQNDYNFQEIGPLGPPSRRACLANKSPARSLLDLADPEISKKHYVPVENIEKYNISCGGSDCLHKWRPERCRNNICATILTSTIGEADVLFNEVTKNELYAHVIPLDKNLPQATSELLNHTFIACDWAPELYLPGLLGSSETKVLGTTPCIDSNSTFPSCPFETRQITMYCSAALADYINVRSALQKYNISMGNMRELVKNASIMDPLAAARKFVNLHPPQLGREVHVAVFSPITTDRDAFNAAAFRVAAVLAETDEKREENSSISFKVQVLDDSCHAQTVTQLLTERIMTQDYGYLSAIVGSACGSAWAETTQPHLSAKMPTLAYTLQVPAPQPKGQSDFPYQLLAAGDARDAAFALAELVNRLKWRRVAALYEPATKKLVSALHNELIFSTEVLDNRHEVEPPLKNEHIVDWATRAWKSNARILYLCVEDTRVARAALCAAHSRGLTPRAGVVWLLCNTHRPDWLQPTPGDTCTKEQLEEEAEGYFSVAPEWMLKFQKSGNSSKELTNWNERFCDAVRAMQLPDSDCNGAADPYAALLYDLLRQWADSLSHLIKNDSTAIGELYKRNHVKALIDDTVNSEYTGLTGTFKWMEERDAYIRVVSFVISQWDSKLRESKPIGTWSNNSLALDSAALHWYTSDGHIPDDGEETCGVQGLANALNTDCHIAFVVLCVILVAILIVIVTAIAWYCKRRAEKEYRKRLQALGMRPLAIKPVALDRWEVPRERVVINRKLGTGAFGTVYGGHALLSEEQGWSAVAVKTLKAGATTEEKLDFLSEAEAMKRFDHKNVVRLLGVVTKTEPVCTVMEFMLYGDLKNYLLARRHLAMGGGIEETEGMEVDEASPKRLTGMALDVARALSYLGQLRYVHRDVAARNCLVSARRVVKIADFGMTRLVFENDYYRFSRKGMLPVRWMAPESLTLGVFSPASDVWSFGVLLYEIVTFGSLPFQGLSNSEVLTKVKGGQTLDLPRGLKPQLGGLIKSCWQQDPKKRPTASEIAAFLADSPRLLTPCLDMPLDILSLDSDPPWRLPRDQAEARWISWAAPASAGTDTTYLSTEGQVPLDTDSFLP